MILITILLSYNEIKSKAVQFSNNPYYMIYVSKRLKSDYSYSPNVERVLISVYANKI